MSRKRQQRRHQQQLQRRWRRTRFTRGQRSRRGGGRRPNTLPLPRGARGVCHHHGQFGGLPGTPQRVSKEYGWGWRRRGRGWDWEQPGGQVGASATIYREGGGGSGGGESVFSLAFEENSVAASVRPRRDAAQVTGCYAARERNETRVAERGAVSCLETRRE